MDIEKLAIFAIFSSSELKKNRKYTSDTYKSIVFQVPLTEPYTFMAESLRLKYFQSYPEQKIRQITTGSGLGSLAHIYICAEGGGWVQIACKIAYVLNGRPQTSFIGVHYRGRRVIIHKSEPNNHMTIYYCGTHLGNIGKFVIAYRKKVYGKTRHFFLESNSYIYSYELNS